MCDDFGSRALSSKIDWRGQADPTSPHYPVLLAFGDRRHAGFAYLTLAHVYHEARSSQEIRRIGRATAEGRRLADANGSSTGRADQGRDSHGYGGRRADDEGGISRDTRADELAELCAQRGVGVCGVCERGIL